MTTAHPDDTTNSQPNHLGKNLGKSLTHVEAVVRERTVEKLGMWMKERERSVGDLDFLEMMQFWKALYFCMWMTDKPLIQEEMSDTLATLATNFVRPRNLENYFLAFFETLRQEWTTIDYLRLDKFLSMTRRFVREWLLMLERAKWRGEALDHFAEVFTDRVLFVNPQPDGIRMHLAFIYLTEVHRVGGAGLSRKAIDSLLTPFHRALLHPPSPVFYRAVVEDVFLKLSSYQVGKGEEGEGEEDKFKNLSLAEVSRRMFREAADDETISATKRKEIYALARRLSPDAGSSSSTLEAASNENNDDASSKAHVVVKPSGKSMLVGFMDDAGGEPAAKDDKKKKRREREKEQDDEVDSENNPPKRTTTSAAKKKLKGVVQMRDDDEGEEEEDKEPLPNPNLKTKLKKNKNSRLSLDSTGSQKSVRFSHADIVPLHEVTKHMKKTKAKSASEFGRSEKGILRR